MDNIALVGRVNVDSLVKELDAHPEIWNQNTARTRSPESPHHGCDDIWARFAESLVIGAEPHESVWYECADSIPSIKTLADELMTKFNGKQLGGILITRIPVGQSVKPHKDSGWHAEHYEKFGVSVKANPQQAFHFQEKSLVTRPGDVFWFYNQNTHWVTNDSDEERVTAIFCIKR